ncbi:hypothetical protein PENSUB_11519 [Penicillium subrubescens]|uniref:Uncharacterized protein n=1 Tax=Penicillium subrubescens TaxID=1316194 RepID=A0A1Q5T376_9EURO|nr:hypothetical protein PENSUB_11519 [Penicillium subrubescens]
MALFFPVEMVYRRPSGHRYPMLETRVAMKVQDMWSLGGPRSTTSTLAMLWEYSGSIEPVGTASTVLPETNPYAQGSNYQDVLWMVAFSNTAFAKRIMQSGFRQEYHSKKLLR